jgi:Ohr subfamily peroxiredoxin
VIEKTKLLYTAEATATGGREGHARTSDGRLDVDLDVPVEMGGTGGPGTNPEQLFAVGYAACFEGAIKAVARRQKLDADEVSIDSRVDFGPADDRSFTIAVGLDVTLPGFDDEQAAEIVRAAHQVCPYSNATRGNIDVALTANGRAVS